MISHKTFSQETVKRRSLALARLARRANLYDSDAVVKALNASAWSAGTRNIALMAYKDYLRMRGLPVPQMPYYRECPKLPYIPLESELDQLISGMRPWRACLLKLLKDTGLRPIEVWRLKWTDLDIVQKTVSIPATKRGNRARVLASLLLEYTLFCSFMSIPSPDTVLCNRNYCRYTPWHTAR
jgi:integrase